MGFSLEPRFQAAQGSQKEDLDPSGDLQISGPGPRSASFEYLGGNFNATVRCKRMLEGRLQMMYRQGDTSDASQRLQSGTQPVQAMFRRWSSPYMVLAQ